jgi:hypothetical protein
MMIRKIFPLLVLCGLAVGMTSPASAVCNSSFPPGGGGLFLNIGSSLCVTACPSDIGNAILLTGTHNGPQAIPHLIIQPGCGQTTLCNTDPNCPPLCVPQWPFTPGGDPYEFCPTGYYGESNCVAFILCYEHDDPGTWSLTILNVVGGGCFCLTYDYQLAVNMRSGLVAVGGNNEVTLSWATASEANNARFDIYRGENKVGSVDGLVNSPVGRDYTWRDENALNGVTYSYTLKSVDLSGNAVTVGTASATPRTAGSATVTDYALYQNYPNPFNPSTSIVFDVLEPSNVTLKVFNPMGMEVATLVNGPVGTGNHSVLFNAADLTSGLYFYSIRIGDRFTATRKMLLVK